MGEHTMTKERALDTVDKVQGAVQTHVVSLDASRPLGGLKLKVWFDFVCPFCLLAEQPLAEALKGLDLEIEWMPFELREEPSPTLRPEDDYLPRIWASEVYPLAARLGVPIKLPSISPQPYTRMAFEGLQFAKAKGKADSYVRAVLAAFFQEDRDIGDLTVLKDIAQSTGLAQNDFERSLRDGTYAAVHAEALMIARVERIQAVPTIQLGSFRFKGIPGAAELRRALDSGRAA
jgi:predicted DsbA family dithiol-disulfide isomerase